MPLRHERLGEADPDTLRRDVVDSLQRGELSVLPTETVYGLAVLPSQAAGVRLAQEWKGRPKDQPFTWHIADVADLEKLEVKVPLAAQRLIERYWPGPLTLILPGKDGQTVGVRLPAHEFTRSVIRARGEPPCPTAPRACTPPSARPSSARARGSRTRATGCWWTGSSSCAATSPRRAAGWSIEDDASLARVEEKLFIS